MDRPRKNSKEFFDRLLEGGLFTFLQPRSERYRGPGVITFDVEVGKQKISKKDVDFFNSML